MSTFEKMFDINVNGHTEKKEGLTYLSWAWAWAEFKKANPTARYEIKHWDGKPYLYDENLGYMVETSITVEEETHYMWLPVMDSKNKAQKSVAYEYETKTGKKTVQPATMFDVNTAIMRCLVKNMAMFGLGLYIYAGEDLPQAEVEAPITGEQIERICELVKDIDKMCEYLNVNSINDLTYLQANAIIKRKEQDAKIQK